MTRVHSRVGDQPTARCDGSTTLVPPRPDALVHALAGAEC